MDSTQVLRVLVLLLLAHHTTAQGLFPPVKLSVNLAKGRPVEATSVCDAEENCNSTCPYGDSFANGTVLFLLGEQGELLVSFETKRMNLIFSYYLFLCNNYIIYNIYNYI